MPTKSGWKLLALAAVAALAGRVLGILELHIAAATTAAAVLIAVAMRLVHPARLSIRRSVSSTMVAVSETVEVRLDITNSSRIVSPTARLEEPVNPGARFSLAPLAAHATATKTYRLHPARRGVLEIAPTLVSDVDGLGLATRRRSAGPRTRVIVHPVIEPLVSPRLPLGGDLALPVDFRRRSLGLDSEEFDVLRPYTEGDDLRHIHWRSTARLEELTVRRFQPSRPGCLTVVIDTRPPGDARDAQDRTTSVAGSLACAVLRAGDDAQIVTTDGRGTARLTGSSGIPQALEFLALLDGGSPAVGAEHFDDASVVVVVTADPQAASDPDTRHSLALRLHASLIVTHGGPASVVAPAANLDEGWIHVTGEGQLPDLWRAAATLRRPMPTAAWR